MGEFLNISEKSEYSQIEITEQHLFKNIQKIQEIHNKKESKTKNLQKLQNKKRNKNVGKEINEMKHMQRKKDCVN